MLSHQLRRKSFTLLAPVPLRIAPGRGSSNQQEDNNEEVTTPSTTTTSTTTTSTTTTTTPFTTTTTTTTTQFTTSRPRSTTKASTRFNSASNAATMLNNALGNPAGNSFMQFFMGNKELNNINFAGDKLSPSPIPATAAPDVALNQGPIESTDDVINLLAGGQDLDSQRINEFEKLVIKQSEPVGTTPAPFFPEQLPAIDTDPFNFSPETNENAFKDFMQTEKLKNSEFPDFSTMFDIDSPTPIPTRTSPDLSRFRTSGNFQQTSSESPRVNMSAVNPQAALMNFLLKTNLKEPGTTIPTSFDPFLRETTTLDKTPSGNFLQILMGHQRLNVDEKSSDALKKLQKRKIPLDQSGNNFMAMSIGDQVCFKHGKGHLF